MKEQGERRVATQLSLVVRRQPQVDVESGVVECRGVGVDQAALEVAQQLALKG